MGRSSSAKCLRFGLSLLLICFSMSTASASASKTAQLEAQLRKILAQIETQKAPSKGHPAAAAPKLLHNGKPQLTDAEVKRRMAYLNSEVQEPCLRCPCGGDMIKKCKDAKATSCIAKPVCCVKDAACCLVTCGLCCLKVCTCNYCCNACGLITPVTE